MLHQHRLIHLLTRREREIMDIIYRHGQLTAAEIRAEMGSPPTHSAVRAMLGALQRKGFLLRDYRGPRFIYWPAMPLQEAQRQALSWVVETFFSGDPRPAALLLEGLAEAGEMLEAR